MSNGNNASNAGKDVLVTPYESAPGHGPSISAYCHAQGVTFGYHPWDHGHRNFQILDSEGHLLVNTNQPDQHWTFPLANYVVKYMGKPYSVNGVLCDSVSTTTSTAPSTTLTSVPPTVTTETTVLQTTTTEAPVTTTTEATTTTVPVPLSSTTTEIPATTQPPVVTTWSTTPDQSLTSLIPVVSVTTTVPPSSDTLPHTGAPIEPVIMTGLALTMIGYALKKRFALRKV